MKRLILMSALLLASFANAEEISKEEIAPETIEAESLTPETESLTPETESLVPKVPYYVEHPIQSYVFETIGGVGGSLAGGIAGGLVGFSVFFLVGLSNGVTDPMKVWDAASPMIAIWIVPSAFLGSAGGVSWVASQVGKESKFGWTTLGSFVGFAASGTLLGYSGLELHEHVVVGASVVFLLMAGGGVWFNQMKQPKLAAPSTMSFDARQIPGPEMPKVHSFSILSLEF